MAFYRRVRPGGPGWARVARRPAGRAPEPIGGLFVDWVAGWVLIYAVLFGIGTALLDSVVESLPYFVAAALSAALIVRDLSRRGWHTVTR